MMATVTKLLILTLLIGSSITPPVSADQFITHTPCHEQLRQLHVIPPSVDCSVIKWNLVLIEENAMQTFRLTSEWGFYVT
jgi:hypothetical protein